MGHEVFLGKGGCTSCRGTCYRLAFRTFRSRVHIPLFSFDLFKGILALFLLEMGLITAVQLGSLKKYGAFLIGFGIVMPVIFGALGVVIGYYLDLSIGGTAVVATLIASASYIAVPAAMRISVPEANPTLSLTASLGITFPFNIMLGIPLYLAMANQLHLTLGG